MLKNIFVFLFITSTSYAQSMDSNPLSNSESTSTKDIVEEVIKEAGENAGKPQKIERMEVTGSHIKRIDVEGPSPVVTIDKKQMEKSGYNSVADVLRNMTAATGGVGRETAIAGGASTGAATVSLRGMDSENILILLDGRRLPTIGGESSIDINLIPMSAIDRVEVLKDGASATYGSDALGGVINFITKKNFSGTAFTSKYTHPEETGGTRADLTMNYGDVGDKHTLLTVMNYRHNEAVYLKERNFGRLPDSDISQLSSYSGHGTWFDNATSTFNASSNCPANLVDPDGLCKFNFSPYMMSQPQLKQLSAMVSGTYDITPEVKLFARTIGTARETYSQIAPPPDSFDDATATGGLNTLIPNDVAKNNLGLTSAQGDVSLLYRLVGESGAGPRRSRGLSASYGFQTGVSGYLSDTWEWQVGGSYMGSNTKDTGISGYANKKVLFEMLKAGTFNPMKPMGQKDNISVASYQPVMNIESTVSGLDAKASGEVFEIPAGSVGLAIGASQFWQTYREDSDDITKSGAQWGGGSLSVGAGRRNFQSLFTEASVPLIKNMELQIAGRFDHYSDFGNALNPKLGLKYSPLKQVMVRGSWGTGFKAPSLTQLYQGKTATYPTAIDTVQCPPGTDTTSFPCQSRQMEMIAGGNPNLKQELSESFNVGVVVEPSKNISLGADYFQIAQNSVVADFRGDEGLQSLFDAERVFGSSVLQSQYGVNIIRDSSGRVTRIIAPSTNISSNKIRGIDLNLNVKFNAFENWDLIGSIDHTIMMQNEQEPFPGLKKVNYNGLAGNPVWRNSISLGLANPMHSVTSTVRTIPGQFKNNERATPGCCGKFRDHTEVDINYALQGVWKGVSVNVGVLNLFSTNRPLDYTEFGNTGYMNTALYDPFGRSFYMSYTQEI